jgi:hypothetical protein
VFVVAVVAVLLSKAEVKLRGTLTMKMMRSAAEVRERWKRRREWRIERIPGGTWRSKGEVAM